ncbi:chemotaxis protein CheB [Chitinophagaceae bacterium LWZ2-11]
MLENASKFDLIIIGGSAGSLNIIEEILAALPSTFEIPIIIIIHRMRNVLSEMDKLLSVGTGNKKVIEPEDKTPLKSNYIYLAPQNYHLLIEEDRTLSLDYSEQINFSRPSIDVSFESAAKVFKNKLLAILLSGANKDGGIRHSTNFKIRRNCVSTGTGNGRI